LPARLATPGPVTAVTRIGRDRFASSFVRVTYQLQSGTGELRCMFTFRRKSTGRRLNQGYYG
jgi:RNase P protein component